MIRPWKIWLVFALCAGVVLAALGWISYTALQLEHLQLQADQQAEIEERVRLALWRMDSQLTPLIVQESARPWTDYQTFSEPPGALTKGGAGFNNTAPGEVLVPSPLLTFSSRDVLLHFQMTANGQLACPQVPTGQQLAFAQDFITAQNITLASNRLAQLRRILGEPVIPAQLTGFQLRPQPGLIVSKTYDRNQVASVEKGRTPNPKIEDLDNRSWLIRESAAVSVNDSVNPVTAKALALNNGNIRQSQEAQQALSSSEFNNRVFINQGLVQSANANYAAQIPIQTSPQLPVMEAGLIKPLWLGDALVLARRVGQGQNLLVQGVWLNWTNLQASLLRSTRDLFWEARLEPVFHPENGHEARMLASIPAKLVPGMTPFLPAPFWTPVRFSLALAWSCVLLAALAIAGLLYGIVSLSERRAAFVSAVTHELRTPLTTFKMYSEMLADDMVPDPAQRKSYLSTLCSEASRLSHLVENVLAYARLERGSARSRIEKITLGELMAKIKPRLLERVAQAGVTLLDAGDAPTLSTSVFVDVAAVEQILFNLVDNACKYAAPSATERIIHLEALPDGKFAMLRVRDHGQGISAVGARRLFQPFSKSAHEAAHTAPGVGLGLALCRRLSRSMGGDLRFSRLEKAGACFDLRLPLCDGGTTTASIG